MGGRGTVARCLVERRSTRKGTVARFTRRVKIRFGAGGA